jgi:dethiobiotin synthetase
MAAAALDWPVPTVADLADELVWPTGGVDIGLVETAGGVRSPQAGDGDVRPLQAAVAPDAVVLVADAGLGTLNAVRLSLDALADEPAPVVVLNRFAPTSDVHLRNRHWLAHVDELGPRVVTDDDLDALAARLAGAGRA